MNKTTYQRLEYDRIKQRLADFAMSYLGRAHIENMEPKIEMVMVATLLQETEEAVSVIAHGASVPIPSLEGIEPLIGTFGKGFIFTPQDFMHFARFIESTQQLKSFMKKKESATPRIASYALSLYDLRELLAEIRRCIRNGQVDNEASAALSRVRKKMNILDDRIRKKLDTALSKYHSYLQESVVSTRGGRYVLSVKKEYRKQVGGAALDESASGQTVFIEPADIADLHVELLHLQAAEAAEAAEETRVLSDLTDLVEGNKYEISINLETIGYYDFMFAKAKFARIIDGRTVKLNDRGRISIHNGRHPLLGGHSVPLDIHIGDDYRALVITGPNTGGKTVSLKTVGLLTLMVQSGLLVPVGEGSEFAVYRSVMVDIGDGQSIENSLSTFSSHVKNVIGILKEAGPSSLVLLDELASGTDPGEGIGLSIAVLEELYRRGATVMATTHFNEIKKFADAAPGFENARMEFDAETLEPLYKLTIGQAGSSYAFYIAQKLGMPLALIERSKQITYEATQRSPEAPAIAAAVTGETPVKVPLKEKAERAPMPNFAFGDCVWVHSLRRTGIVCSEPDHRGNITVQIQKEKVRINRKRLSLYIERSKLYPEGDYDMDIVFESKDTRKKRKQMSKRHVEGLTIEYKENQ
ncbi:endonuclease MutS2 [Paenibacillus sp. Soil787]|uniref:endonuclease MutS2 n=1 Tax=Paenibacillus sp. Soil787 TaxID=1736411 RepID=UPI000703A2B2|nr:DNA mismatch repair protein MutS [Paenibacillus sp. Soil787]KRF09914.1 DNA mismatch repair protein MutS [Paenibacillus sp. Soil787]